MNTKIVSDSSTKNAIMNAFRLCCTFSQLARIQNGSVKVVSSTKYSEIPSTPNRSEKKPGCDSSDTNWYPMNDESNSPHMTIDSTNVNTVNSSVTFLIRDKSAGVVSCIGATTRDPIMGSAKIVVSMMIIRVAVMPV